MNRLTIKEYFNIIDSTKEKDYINRYNAIKNSVQIKWYRLTYNNHLVLHFKVPSEKSKRLMYDTLVEFCTTNMNASSIRQSEIKVFSNCPSYVFMNARVAHNNNYDIEWANGLFAKETLAPPPEDKADKVPTEIRIERGLFFAIYHIKQMSDIEIMHKAMGAIRIPNGKALALFIKDQDWVMEKRGQIADEKKLKNLIEKLSPVKSQNRKVGVSKLQNTTKTIKSATSKKTSKTTKTKKI